MSYRLLEQELIKRLLFDYMHTSKTLLEICSEYRTSTATVYRYLDQHAGGARRQYFRPLPEFLV